MARGMLIGRLAFLSDSRASTGSRWLTSSTSTALGIAAVAVAIRLALMLAWSGFRAPLTYEYEEIATNILAGRGFLFPHLNVEYLSMRPVFVYLCVAVYWMTGHSHIAMLVVQAIVSGGTTLVIYTLGWRLGGPATATVAAVATAVDPALVYYDVTRVHPLGLQALLLSVALLAFVALLDAPRWTVFLLAGLATGSAAYERGTIVFFVPAALILVKLRHGLPLRSWGRMIIVFGIGVLVIHAPWLVRNYVVYGKPVFIMTASPELLWIGNNPNATGTALGNSGRPMLDETSQAFREKIFAADELTQQQIFREELLRFMATQPVNALKLFMRKFYYSWWFSPQSGREHPSWALPLYKPVYALILLAALWGSLVGLARAGRLYVVTLLLFLLVISLGQSLFFVEGRHRMALIPVVLLLAAAGALDLFRRARHERHV